jgi:hypothetical protein
MKGLVFWKRWLIAVSLLLIALGLGMVLLGFAPQKPSDDPVIEAFFGGNLPAGGTTAFFGWAFAVWGSTIVGWGADAAIYRPISLCASRALGLVGNRRERRPLVSHRHVRIARLRHPFQRRAQHRLSCGGGSPAGGDVATISSSARRQGHHEPVEFALRLQRRAT